MEDYNQNRVYSIGNSGSKALSKSFMSNVFLWMFAALATSTVFAFLFSSSPALLSYLIDFESGKLSLLGQVARFAPILFVLAIGLGYTRFSASTLMALFLTYAAINGISFSFILLIYTAGSVVTCFASAAAMFGVMAVMGYTTNKDLTSFGRIMMMGLIGILVASLINFFMHSSQLEYIISFVGVGVFVGLTAYDVQKLKRIGQGIEYGEVGATDAKKMSVLGALTLYLDFINIFLMLLRLFGKRRD